MPLTDYASPIMRAAVFHQLHPGAIITYRTVSIGEGFPHGDYSDEADEAIICEIICPDGQYFRGVRECSLRDDRGKPVPRSAEAHHSHETKALGRALRDAGIPQRLSELTMLMRWWRDLQVGAPPPERFRPEPAPDAPSEDEVDGADAGATPLDEYRAAVAGLAGPLKAELSKRAREAGIANIMAPGDHLEQAEALLKEVLLADMTDEEEPEEPF